MAKVKSRFVRNDISRIFVNTNPNEEYDYHNCMRVDGLSKTFADIETVYCPHPTIAKAFIEAAEIETGGDSRWSTSLIGRMPLYDKSVLYDLAVNKKSFDLQVHFGECYDVSDFNSFDMAIILENARINSYDTDPLGSLQSDEVAMVNETVALTASAVHYVYTPILSSVGEEVSATGGIVDLISSTNNFCRGNETQILFGLKLPSNGVGNDIYIVYSEDNGVSWQEVLLDCTATLSVSPLTSYNIASDGINLYITLNQAAGNGHLYVVKIDSVLNGATGVPLVSSLDNVNSIYATKSFGKILVTVGQSGIVNLVNTSSLVYYEIPNSGGYNLYAIDGESIHDFVVAGDNGLLMVYSSGSGFRTIPIVVGGDTITDIITTVVVNGDNWVIGTDAGQIITTVNAGKTWVLREVFTGCITDIKFFSSIIGFTLLKSGEVYRTVDSGVTWVLMEDTLNQVPVNVESFGLVVQDANTFYAYGRIPGDVIANPCDPLNQFEVGDTGWIIKGGT